MCLKEPENAHTRSFGLRSQMNCLNREIPLYYSGNFVVLGAWPYPRSHITHPTNPLIL